MVRAEIAITLREEFGVTAVSQAHPGAEFRYLAGIAEPDRGLGLVEVRANALDDILAAVASTAGVRNFELLDRWGDRAVFQYETEVAMLYRAVRESGIIPAFPYVIRDGTLYFETTTTPERLSRLAKTLADRDIPTDVRAVSSTRGSPVGLTERQREFVDAAIEMGYYETPRDCTIADLATAFDVATSTASRILHRAEAQVMKQYLTTVTEASDR